MIFNAIIKLYLYRNMYDLNKFEPYILFYPNTIELFHAQFYKYCYINYRIIKNKT